MKSALNAATAGLLLLAGMASGSSLAAPNVIEFNQVPCQILESESGKDRGFQSQVSADCQRINSSTLDQRTEDIKPMVLRPGTYIFRVSNKNVPYELGFWLRGKGGLNRAILPSVSGGGLSTGRTQDYMIKLVPGEYLYSCPLNPTPDYPLLVTPN